MRAGYRATAAVRTSARRQRFPSQGFRFQSTTANPAQNPATSHALAGVAGGAASFLLIYAWYHFSGTKQIVNTASSTISSLKDAKNKVQEAAPSPSAVLKFLRSTAKSYGAAIPGAAGAIDYSFDRLDELAETHGDQVKQIAQDAYGQVQDVINSAQGKDAGEKILNAINEAVGKLNKLASDVDKNYIGPFLDKNPQLKKALEGSQDQLKEIVDKQGPEAKKIRDDTYKQLTALAAAGFTAESIPKAVALIKEKSEEVKNLAQKTGASAYEAASKNAQPLLQKVPDLQKMLDEQMPKLEGFIGQDGVKQLKSMYEKLSDLSQKAKNKDASELAKEAEKIIREGLEEAKKTLGSAGGNLGEKLKSAGGPLAALESLPGFQNIPELQSLSKIASARGDEAQKLMTDTYEEIKEVLKKKASEAEKIGKKAKEDVKKAK